ncbi:MAG: AAA family ATPase, partial [Chloroflexi bacterium]|nr:AAA family ATPase [Chloroflexota bacterium]
MKRGITDRQSQIVELLSGQPRPVAIPEVAKRLGCSVRTVHREVVALRHAGVAISAETGRSGGLTIERRSGVADIPAESSSSVAARSPGDEFVGRGDENGRLDRVFDEVISGQGRIVIVLGEPGIGKTRLTRELTARATSRGASMAWGQCRDIEGTPPYWPWSQAIRVLLDEREPDFATSLPKAVTGPIATVIPELAGLITGADRDTGKADDISQFQLFDSFTQLLKVAAEDGPLLVVLDDLHWADQASLGLLEFLSGEIASTRIMIVGTARTVDPTVAGSLASAMAELARQPGFSRMELEGLSREEIGWLIGGEFNTGPSSRFTDEVFSTTEGNPFFAIEMSRLHPGDRAIDRADGPARSVLPGAVLDVIERRLSGLSEDCVRLLNIGSVLGYRFEYEKLKAVAGPDLEVETLDLMDEALDARVVRETAGPGLTYEFGHALIHRFLYDTMPVGRRVRAHVHVAEELERSHGGNADAHAAELAIHFNEGRSLLGTEKAIKYLVLAAEQAMTVFAPAEAVGYYQRAMDAKNGTSSDVEAGEILFGLGRAQTTMFQPYEAVDTLIRAFDIFEANGEIERAIEVASFGIIRSYGQAPAQIMLCE